MKSQLARSAGASALVAWLASCSFLFPDRETILQRSESSHRDTLDRLYPPGSDRAEIMERWGEPLRSRRVTENRDDGFMQFAAQVIERDLETAPVTCDVYWVFRMGLASAFGPAGVYWDYVFYDLEGRVIQARRRFLD